MGRARGGVAVGRARHRGPHRARGLARRPRPAARGDRARSTGAANGVNASSEHHLRLWYALADLYERAGDLPRARELFDRVREHDAAFADVAERLAALG